MRSKKSKRTFFKTTFTVQLTTESPIPDDMDEAEMLRESVLGDYVGATNYADINKPITAKEAVKRLEDSGSDPEFFQLNADGSDVVD